MAQHSPPTSCFHSVELWQDAHANHRNPLLKANLHSKARIPATANSMQSCGSCAACNALPQHFQHSIMRPTCVLLLSQLYCCLFRAVLLQRRNSLIQHHFHHLCISKLSSLEEGICRSCPKDSATADSTRLIQVAGVEPKSVAKSTYCILA